MRILLAMGASLYMDVKITSAVVSKVGTVDGHVHACLQKDDLARLD